MPVALNASEWFCPGMWLDKFCAFSNFSEDFGGAQREATPTEHVCQPTGSTQQLFLSSSCSIPPPPTADTPSRIMVKVFPGLGVNSPSHVQPYWGLPFHPWTLLTAFLKKVWSRMNFLVAYKAEGFTWKEGRRAECVGALGLPQPQGL